MYSNVKSVQLLVQMLKQKNIKNIVVSAGTSHDAIARSLEEDSFFKTYNIIDERSACFFALGLIQELNTPVAICCTAGTAGANYMSGVIEASKREMPLIVITADKNPYYLNQQEDQMFNQNNLYRDNVKKSVTLPIIKNDKDKWYCSRLLNEAFLELNHHGQGPIHINIPIEDGMFAIGNVFTTQELEKINIINRYDKNSNGDNLKALFNSLKDKKVFICYGQDYNIEPKILKLIEEISEKYNCIFAVEKLSNIHCKGSIEITRATKYLSANFEINSVIPDIYIKLAGNTPLDAKFVIKKYNKQFKTWVVNSTGNVEDYLKNLSVVFEGTTMGFLEEMNKYKVCEENTYLREWEKANDEFKIPEFEYSQLYTIQQCMNKLPKDSILNLANSSTIRLAEYFNLDPSINVYCNRGIHGIDGCMSTFIGQSAVTEKHSFLIIGDLTFFYDMNALWNRYLGKNIRIMLNNNHGASLFHFNQGLSKYPTLNENVAADHNATAKGWTESRGFEYLSANNKKEFDENLLKFVREDSEKPIIFEVFTNKEDDAKIQHEFYDYNVKSVNRAKKEVKSIIKKAIGR